MTLTLRKTRKQVLRSPCRAQATPLSLPPGDQLSHKGVLNRVTCLQVQVFFLVKTYKYLLTKFILFQCSMKYETWAPSMHWPWIIKDYKSSPTKNAKNCVVSLFLPLGISNMVTASPMYIHNIHNHNDIISSQWHYQHQHHLILMTLSSSTTSHLNIISYQHYHNHQHHLILLYHEHQYHMQPLHEMPCILDSHEIFSLGWSI